MIAADSIRSYSPQLNSFYAHTLPKVMPIMMLVQLSSIYMTVCAAVDCFIDVWFKDTLGRRICTARSACLIIGGKHPITIRMPRKYTQTAVEVCICLYCLPSIFELETVHCWKPKRPQFIEVPISALEQKDIQWVAEVSNRQRKNETLFALRYVQHCCCKTQNTS